VLESSGQGAQLPLDDHLSGLHLNRDSLGDLELLFRDDVLHLLPLVIKNIRLN
jgi:hypothetical protein